MFSGVAHYLHDNKQWFSGTALTSVVVLHNFRQSSVVVDCHVPYSTLIMVLRLFAIPRQLLATLAGICHHSYKKDATSLHPYFLILQAASFDATSGIIFDTSSIILFYKRHRFILLAASFDANTTSSSIVSGAASTIVHHQDYFILQAASLILLRQHHR